MSIARVAVIGAGTMGQGIALAAAGAGFQVALHDVDEHRLSSAFDAIQSRVTRASRNPGDPDSSAAVLARMAAVPTLSEAVHEADLVIEAIPEQMETKRQLFTALDRAAPATAILATNTSSLSILKIAETTGDPRRVLGLHFFNPVHRMALVEVVRGKETSQDTLDVALDFVARLGKEPIVVRDTPGFATSRLGVALGLEAMRMVEEGVAAPAEIDRAMELGYNHPMGPLRLSDLIGLDVRLGIAEHLHTALGGERFRPPEILRRMVANGRLGRKSGRGFYEWDEPGVEG